MKIIAAPEKPGPNRRYNGVDQYVAEEPLETILPPDPPKTDPNKVFTQAELSTYDFTGWEWGKLPYQVVKAARNGGHAIVTAKIECVECKRPMWSCHPKLEDLCEEDDYLLRVRNWEALAERAKRNNLKPVNPWADSEEIPQFFWPKDET